MTRIYDILDSVEERKSGKFTVRISAKNDDDADLSFLGEYVNKPKGDVYIDRQENVLYTGKETNKSQDFTEYAFATSFADELDEKPNCYDVDIDEKFVINKPISYIVSWVEREVVEIYGDYSRNEYRYWIPCNPENEPKHIVEDYEYHRKYGDSWYMVGIIVTVSYKGVELGSSSLWGVGSDTDKDDLESIIQDCISEAMAEAEKKLDDLKKD